jgi:hypothetical protein
VERIAFSPPEANKRYLRYWADFEDLYGNMVDGGMILVICVVLSVFGVLEVVFSQESGLFGLFLNIFNIFEKKV